MPCKYLTMMLAAMSGLIVGCKEPRKDNASMAGAVGFGSALASLPQPVVIPADSKTPAPTGRTCAVATFATFSGATVKTYEITKDCTTRLLATVQIETDGYSVQSMSWPHRDQPMLIAFRGSPQVLVAVESVLTDDVKRPAPRKLKVPGKGETEPEGHEFSIFDDGETNYVERCTSWDQGDNSSGESEEWDCRKHVFFKVLDNAGAKAKAITPSPRPAFMPSFTGGMVPGTNIELQVVAKSATLRCTVDGKNQVIHNWEGRPQPIVVVPLSSTDFLLGYDTNGSRMHPAKYTWFERRRNCEETPLFADHVKPGPNSYWANRENVERASEPEKWRIRLGADAKNDILDPVGALGFEADDLVWTSQ
jgi:hypothetical protein